MLKVHILVILTPVLDLMFCGIAGGKYMKIYSLGTTDVLDVKRTAESWLFPKSVPVSRDVFLNANVSASHSFFLTVLFYQFILCQGNCIKCKISFLDMKRPYSSSFPIQKFLWQLSYHLGLLMGLQCRALTILLFLQIFYFLSAFLDNAKEF